MSAALRVLFLSLSACSAPVIAPSAELAGSQPVGSNGVAVESVQSTPPFSAWTTATPLTLVAPGGDNLGVLERVGIRVEVLQIRAGRIHVSCTGCEEKAKDAQGYLPRQVLWAAPPLGATAPQTAEDPLSLLLAHRSRWAAGHDLPEGTTAAAMCWLADQGVTIDGSKASSLSGNGSLLLQRTGASWRLTEVQGPASAPGDWACGQVRPTQ